MWLKLLRLAAWLSLAAIVVVTLAPVGLRPNTGVSSQLERFLAFFALGLMFAIAYRRHFLIVAALLLVGTVGLELLQYLVPSRHGRIDDLQAKAIGCLGGAIVGWLVAYPWQPRTRDAKFRP